MDLLLERFLEHHWRELDEDGRYAFERLLDEQDPVILDWITGRGTPGDAALLPIIERLRVVFTIPPHT